MERKGLRMKGLGKAGIRESLVVTESPRESVETRVAESASNGKQY